MSNKLTTDRLAEVLDAIANAYEAGCQDVHDNYQPDRDPDFSEAARDYAKNVELPATQSLSTDLDKAQSQLVDAEQRIAELEGVINSALACTPTIGQEYVGIAGMPYRNVIQYDCGNPWDILRAALNQSKESGNEG